MEKTIVSENNDLFKMFKSLLSSKGIKKENLFILSGQKIINEALKNSQLEVMYEITHQKLIPVLAAEESVKQVILATELFQNLDELGTHFNLLICRKPEFQVLKNVIPNKKTFSILLPLGDPTNLGAAIRSAVGFNVDEIILLPESANPYLPKSIKASAGAVLNALLYKANSLDDFKENLIVLDQKGVNLQDFQWPEKVYLLVGEEGPGVNSILKENKNLKMININTQKIESLNATVSLSIALYDWNTKVKT